MSGLLALLPVIGFWAVEALAGTRVALVVGIVLALLDLAWTRLRTGAVGRLPLLTAGLVLGLGGLSLASDDERFARVTPVVSDLLFATILAGAEWRRPGVLGRLIREQDPEVDLHPLQERWLGGLAYRAAGVLAAHAGLTLWAVGAEHATWAFVSGPLQLGMLGAQVALETAWARLVLLPAVEEAEAAEAAGDAGTEGR